MENKIWIGILVVATLLVMTLSSVNADMIGTSSVAKYREYHIGNNWCLHEPINSKVMRNPISAENYWMNNPVICDENAILEVNLNPLGKMDYSLSPCEGKELSVMGTCTKLEQPHDAEVVPTESRTHWIGNGLGTDKSIFAKKTQKFYQCRWEYADGTPVHQPVVEPVIEFRPAGGSIPIEE